MVGLVPSQITARPANIRKFVVKADHLEDLVRLWTMTRSAARFLDASVVAGLNILVAGGTQYGKMSLLNCLSSAIPCGTVTTRHLRRAGQLR